MKKVLVIILSVLLVISAGLLTYGVIQGPKKEIEEEETAMFSAPAPDLFYGDADAQKINVTDLYSSNKMANKSEKVANMIINASYNNILINQFYFKAHVDVEPTSNKDKFACSDYYRAKNGVNMFYQTLAYTGTFNLVQARIDYVDQRLEKNGEVEYDKETKTWSYSLKSPSVKGTTLSLPALTPYNIYSWYDFPLDLGGVRAAGDGSTSGRTEAIDYSLIDETSVKIEEKQDADGNAYYKITFSALIEKAQASQETITRFSESFSSLKKVEFSELNFDVEIWKDAGVFRQIAFDARVTASIGSDRGEVNIQKALTFSYDDKDCSVAAHIKKLADEFDQKWITKLSAKNQAQLKEEVAALPAEEEKAEDAAE